MSNNIQGPEPRCECGKCKICKRRKANNKIGGKKYIIAHKLGIKETKEIMKIRIKAHGDLLAQTGPKSREIRSVPESNVQKNNTGTFQIWSTSRREMLSNKIRSRIKNIQENGEWRELAQYSELFFFGVNLS